MSDRDDGLAVATDEFAQDFEDLLTWTSRLEGKPVGSSARISGGSFASARAGLPRAGADRRKADRGASTRCNATTAGVLTWPHPRCGEQSPIGYRATLGPERGDLWLSWATADPSTVQEQEREQVDRAAIDLTGPRRQTWWFACYDDLVWKLHLPAGSSRFASRREHGLAYRSQRQSPRDRAVSRAWKARSRLDASATSAALASSRNGCVGTPSTPDGEGRAGRGDREPTPHCSSNSGGGDLGPRLDPLMAKVARGLCLAGHLHLVGWSSRAPAHLLKLA